jgi:hypothetical protein
MKEEKVIYDKWVDGKKILTEENTVAEMSDFQRAFLQKGTGQKLYTELEYAQAVDLAVKMMKDQFMDATQFAIVHENNECAKIAHDIERERHGVAEDDKTFKSDIAHKILMRIRHDNTGAAVPPIDKP